MSRSVSWSSSCTPRLSPASIAWILAVAASRSLRHAVIGSPLKSKVACTAPLQLRLFLDMERSLPRHRSWHANPSTIPLDSMRMRASISSGRARNPCWGVQDRSRRGGMGAVTAAWPSEGDPGPSVPQLCSYLFTEFRC